MFLILFSHYVFTLCSTKNKTTKSTLHANLAHRTHTKLTTEKNPSTMTKKKTIACLVLMVCFQTQEMRVVIHVLLDKQLELIPVRTVQLVKLAQVKQTCSAKNATLGIIKTK